MAEQVLAAVRTGPGTTEMREFPMPEIGDDEALLRIEVAGICGTDVKLYRKPTIDAPVIMGHENIGVVERAGTKWQKIHGLAEGDRIFVEHYVGCMHCGWCRAGEYRHCELTDWRTNPDGRRYGYTSSDNPGRLWGGFSQYMYLPWNAVTHKVPDGVTAELAGLVTPLSNGIEWALNAGKVGYAKTVLIQGPGQQGLSQVVASKQAGASLIVVSGTTRDATRLQLAKDLGADVAIDVQKEDPLDRVMELTGGKGVDVVVDPVGGDRFTDSLRSLAREGRLLVLGFTAGEIPTVKVNRLLLTNTSVLGVASAEFWSDEPDYPGRQWRDLVPLMESGAIDPPIGPLFTLEDAAAAIRELDERRAAGRVLIRMR